MKNSFLTLDLSDKRRVFVVGDIHGAYSKLEKQLEQLKFDSTQDHLLAVGDLIDRGDESERVLEFLNYDWFDSVQGNHEHTAYSCSKSHNNLGGKWLTKLKFTNHELYKKIRSKLFHLPVLIEALTPSKLIGIAHACYPRDDWNEAYQASQDDKSEILWSRKHLEDSFDDYLRGNEKQIRGIDEVYYGHNPLEKKLTIGNQHWIDTGGCWDDSDLTIVEII